MISKRALGLLLGVGLSVQVYAGTQAVLVETLDAKASKTTISTQGGLLKFEQLDNQDTMQMIYNKNKKEMLIVNHKSKTFTRIDKAFIAKVSEQMEMVKQQMAALPPEQREMMKKMMGGNLPAMLEESEADKSVYKKTGQKLSAGEHGCTVTEKYQQGVKQMAFCVADTAKMAGGKELFAITKDMTSLFETLMQSIPGAYSSNPFEDMDALDGFPVMVTEYENGKVISKMELESIKEKSFAADFFNIPKGYKEENAMTMGMGGM